MYHRVVPDDADTTGIEAGMFVRASTFARQLDWLGRRWTMKTLGDALQDPPGADEPSVAVVTFDDGWRDNLEVAWPILAAHRVPATIFLVSDWCATGAHANGSFLRPDEVTELAASGIEFGAHTASHPRLDELEASVVEAEMRRSKEAVEQWTRRSCETFAYPYGRHHDGTAALARRLFRASVVVGGGWWMRGCDPAKVPRVGIHEDMTSRRAQFEARLAGLA